MVLWKGKKLLLHMWQSSCYFSYKSGDKSWMRKGLTFVYSISSRGKFTLYEKMFERLFASLPDNPVSSANKIDLHGILTEVLLKVAVWWMF